MSKDEQDYPCEMVSIKRLAKVFGGAPHGYSITDCNLGHSSNLYNKCPYFTRYMVKKVGSKISHQFRVWLHGDVFMEVKNVFLCDLEIRDASVLPHYSRMANDPCYS